MFRTVLRFELTYWFKRPVSLLFFALLFLMAFFSTASDTFLNYGGTGQIHRNAPFVLAIAIATLTAFGQVITTAIAGTAVLRDEQMRAQELLFTTRMTRAGYLFGRFTGAVAVMLVLYLALPIGLLVGSMMPWVEPEKLGPITIWGVMQPFFTIAVPNLVLVSAILFAIGAITRRLFAVYVSGVVIFLAWEITQDLIANLDNLRFGAMVDPFALTSVGVITRYWSVAEKNTLLVPLQGVLLLNRGIWIGVALVTFALAATLFRLRLPQPPSRWWRRARAITVAPPPPMMMAPAVSLRYDRSAWLRSIAAQAGFQFRFVVREAPFVAFVAINLLNILYVTWYVAHPGDSALWPVTALLVPYQRDSVLFFIVLIGTMYGGELIWRDRQLRSDQLHDVLPAPAWVGYCAKFIALFLATCLLQVTAALALMGLQLAQGYTHFQPLLYLEGILLGPLPTMIAISAVCLGVHAIVNQKYVGHLLIIAYWIGSSVFVNLGFGYKLLQVGVPLSYVYSDMNGWGPYLPRNAVLGLYSVAWCAGIAAIGYLVLPRGPVATWRVRLETAGRRWRAGGGWIVTACATTVLITAGLFYYNANVLNTYQDVRTAERVRRDMELKYKPLESLPEPRIVAVSVQQDFYPERRAAAWRGTMHAVNRSSGPIDTVLISLASASPTPADRTIALSHDGLILDSIGFDRPAALILDDTPRGMRVYRLATALAPGDSLVIHFAERLELHGFPNGEFTNDVAANGSFMSNDFMPHLGYDPETELADDDIRERNGLKPRPRMKLIDDPAMRQANYIAFDGDWMSFDETVCTAADQIAIAPGYLQRDWIADGRHCARYVMDQPILNFFATVSARYVVDSETHHGVSIAIYHDPQHRFALASMMRAAEDGLDYFSTAFSPYQYRQFRILEFPLYQGIAQAFPNTIPFSESAGFLYRMDSGSEALDWTYFVTAHELAHQWWGDMLVGGNGQGSTLMSEGLAEYSALTVMEKRYGPEATQKFFRRELDAYLRGRGIERKKEVPLLFVENQPYIHYYKGSLALYALRNYIGEPAMNAALHHFVGAWAFKGPPYPTARDLYAELDHVTPDSLKYVLKDLFLDMTFYDNKVDSATATRRADGKYAVHLVLAAKKLKGDSLGNMTEVPMADYVDVGIFGPHIGDRKLGPPLRVQKVHITQAVTVLDFVVDSLPERAGIDPYNILIDRAPEDNVGTVKLRAPKGQ